MTNPVPCVPLPSGSSEAGKRILGTHSTWVADRAGSICPPSSLGGIVVVVVVGVGGSSSAGARASSMFSTDAVLALSSFSASTGAACAVFFASSTSSSPSCPFGASSPCYELRIGQKSYVCSRQPFKTTPDFFIHITSTAPWITSPAPSMPPHPTPVAGVVVPPPAPLPPFILRKSSSIDWI